MNGWMDGCACCMVPAPYIASRYYVKPIWLFAQWHPTTPIGVHSVDHIWSLTPVGWTKNTIGPTFHIVVVETCVYKSCTSWAAPYETKTKGSMVVTHPVHAIVHPSNHPSNHPSIYPSISISILMVQQSQQQPQRTYKKKQNRLYYFFGHFWLAVGCRGAGYSTTTKSCGPCTVVRVFCTISSIFLRIMSNNIPRGITI